MSTDGERARRTAEQASSPATRDETAAAPPTGTPLWARLPRRNEREAEADALARSVLRETPAPGAHLRSLHPAPAPPELEEGADRLPTGLRADLSARFGYDLTEVRLLTSCDGARDLGADAFALGRLVAFAPGTFDPASTAGRGLIAHELAHVVIERGEPPAVASQKAAAAPGFYVDVEDAFQKSWGPEELAIRPVLTLFQVVEAEQPTEVKKALDDVERTDKNLLPPLLPKDSTASELMARLMLLGLPGEAIRYRTWQTSLQGVSRGATSGPRTFDTEAWLTEQALARLRGKVSWTDPAAALEQLDAELAVIPVLLKELNSLDPQQLADDRKRLAAVTDPFGQPGWGNQAGKYLTISLWAHRLSSLARTAFTDAQASVQSLMDLVTSELAAGKGDATLVALEKRLDAMSKLPALGGPFEINTPEYRTKGKKDVLVELDTWQDQPGAAARKAQLDSYDADADRYHLYPRPTQEVEPGEIVGARLRQTRVLRRLHGLEKDAQGVTTVETKENEAAIKTLGKDGLKLHSDDDWRRFLLAKYTAARARTSPAEAFDSLIDLVRTYLQAFTTHTPFNIDDFGDNFLTMQFPRALTGQLVHDCGVYAMRIAYMLSLVREEPTLKLEFRWVQLPVHIALVITSSTAPIGAYILHNDAVTRYDAAQLAGLRATWDVTDIKGSKQAAAPRTAKKDDEFLGELASDAFVPLTDAPYRVTAVPHLSGKPAADKGAMWSTYQATLRTKLFGKVSEDPDSPYYQFHLRYLKMLEASKVHYNQWLVPFWNEFGHRAWLANRDALMKADAQRNKATTPDGKKAADAVFDSARTAYLTGALGKDKLKLEEAFDKVQKAYQPIVTMSQAISYEILQKPDIIGADASRASVDRMLEVFYPYLDPAWSRRVQDHLADLKKGLLTSPPYAETRDLLPPVH